MKAISKMKKIIILAIIVFVGLALIGCAYPNDDAKPWDVEMGMSQDDVLSLMDGAPRTSVTESEYWTLWSYTYWSTYWTFGFDSNGRVDYISKY